MNQQALHTDTGDNVLKVSNSKNNDRLAIRTYHCKFCKQLLLATTRTIDALPRRREPSLDRALILPLQGREEKFGSDDEEEDDEEEEGEDEEDEDEEMADEEGEGAGGEDRGMRKRSTEHDDTSQSQSQSQLQSQAQSNPQDQQQRDKRSRRQPHYTILLSTTIPERNAVAVRRRDGFERRILLRCGRCRVLVGYVLDDMLSRRLEGDDTLRLAKEISAAQFVYVLPDALLETGELLDQGGKKEKAAAAEMEWAAWEQLGKDGEQ